MPTTTTPSRSSPPAAPAAPATPRTHVMQQTMHVRAETVDAKTLTMRAVIATETPVAVYDYGRDEIIDEVLIAAGVITPDQVVLLDDHNRWSADSVIGSVRSIGTPTGDVRNAVEATLHFADDDRSRQIFRKYQQRHMTDVSAGYVPMDCEDLSPGETRTIDIGATQRTFTARDDRPLRITKRWVLREVSVTPIGADANARVRAARLESTMTKRTTIDPDLRTRNAMLGDLLTDAIQDQTDDDTPRDDLIQQIADEAGSDAETISAIADGGGSPTLDILNAFATVLDLPLSDLTEAAGMDDDDDDATRADADEEDDDDMRNTDTDKDPEPKGRSMPGTTPPNGTAAGKTAPNTPPVDQNALRREGAELERRRVAKIRANAPDGLDPAIVQRAVDSGWSVQRANEFFLRQLRESRDNGDAGGGNVRVTGRQDDARRGLLVDALAVRAATDAGQRPNQAIPESRRNDTEATNIIMRASRTSIQGFAALCLEHHGTPADSFERDDPNRLVTRAISTTSMPELLTEGVQRILQERYEKAEGTYEEIAAEREVKDFRAVRNLRMSTFSRFPKVGTAGELEHGSLEETREDYGADTYGIRFGMTRRDWINDDLGAILRVPSDLALQARTNITDQGYDLVSSASAAGPVMNEDSLNLFRGVGATSPDGYNLIVGADTALDSDSLGAAKTRLRLMKHKGKFIRAEAEYLLVPPSLEQKAQELVRSPTFMIATGADGTLTRPTTNTHQGTLRVIVEPRLEATSAKAWYVGARTVPTFIVVYLRGNRTPTIERKDPSDVLGIGWWVYHDMGVAAIDWRGIVRAKGES